MGSGVLAIWTDVEPAHEDAFNAWYDEEHVAERVAIPGFLTGQRYVAVAGSPRYFAWYETEVVAVLSSEPYRKALDSPSPRTTHIMPHFRRTVRTAFDVHERLGDGRRGPYAATLRLIAEPGRRDELRPWVAEHALPALVADPGIIAAQLWEGDPDVTAAGGTAEAKMRGGPDQVVETAVLFESESAEAAEAAARAHLGQDDLQAHGATSGGDFGIYRLLLALPSEHGKGRPP